MTSLGKRLDHLEAVQADTTPEPVPVCISDDPAEVEAFRARHEGAARMVILETVCARKCTDDCTERGGHRCRQAKEAQ